MTALKTVEQIVADNPALQRRLLELAVDYCWGAIESVSTDELELSPKSKTVTREIEWMAIGDEDLDGVTDEIDVLRDLGLLEQHPEKPGWVREIAEL